ncbi:hypothetical protein GGI26_000216 [Coemansia sp. RSA 1358]|nr:hypothetical protein GGI26_000216 [Coemansia sp. RSA 1358]
MVCCNTTVNACIFSNYNVHASPDIDIAHISGRKELIRLLVGWSLCPPQQLGYDQTITFNSELGCYEVQVPKGDVAGEHEVYYCDDSVVAATRIFGRHCRCLLATPEKPATKVTSENKLKHTVVIKDSWTVYDDKKVEAQAQAQAVAEAGEQGHEDDSDSEYRWPPQSQFVPRGDARSEIQMLEKVHEKLSGDKQLKGKYPQILAGGWVCQPSGSAACGTSGGKAVIDSTREIIGMLDAEQQKDTPFCLHARHAMTPIGQRLRKVDSAAELVIVLNDAMVCHNAINERCGILHRDISANNILVVREKGKPIQGMLIDFDCAIVESDKSASIRPERTGTLPFMSIANLERMDIQRTVLDDWESLLYLHKYTY